MRYVSGTDETGQRLTTLQTALAIIARDPLESDKFQAKGCRCHSSDVERVARPADVAK